MAAIYKQIECKNRFCRNLLFQGPLDVKRNNAAPVTWPLSLIASSELFCLRLQGVPNLVSGILSQYSWSASFSVAVQRPVEGERENGDYACCRISVTSSSLCTVITYQSLCETTDLDLILLYEHL